MIFFVLNNILAIYISICLSRFLFVNGQDLHRFLVAIVNFAFVVYSVVIITGCAGILSSESIAAVLVTAAVGITLFQRRRRAYDNRSLELKTDLFQGDNKDAVFLKLSLVLFSGFAAEWIYKSFILGTYFGPDDLVYHASIAAQWIVDRKITLVPFSYQAYYPLNAEIMSLWFMLPFQNDTYASATSFYWALLSLAAIFTVLNSLGYSLASCMIVGSLLIGSTGVHGTSVQKILQSFSANDLAGPAMLLAAVAMLFSDKRLSVRGMTINSLYCGLMMGNAVGIKVSFAPVVIIIILWLFFSENDIYSFKQRTSFVLLLMSGIMLTGGFWYIRNILLTGNPLFPAEVGPFRGPFSLDDQYRTKLISWITKAPTNMNQWLHIAKDLGNWPLHFGIISATGYISSIYFLVKNWSNRSNAGIVWRYQGLLIITGLILFFSFFFLPFSATTNHPATALKAANRYVIFPYAIGLLLFGRLIGQTHHGSSFWKYLTIISLLILPFYERNLIVITIFAITAAAVYFRPFLKALTTVVKLRYAGAIFLLAGLVFLMFWYPHKKRLTDNDIYSSIGPAGNVFKEIENFPDASRIGYFSTLPLNNTPFYRLFGRRLQMIPVPLDHDGTVPKPLHVRALEKHGSWWEEWNRLDTEINEKEFQNNIRYSAVEYVIMAQFPYKKWPVQYSAFENMKNAKQIYNDGHSIIWKLLKVDPERFGYFRSGASC